METLRGIVCEGGIYFVYLQRLGFMTECQPVFIMMKRILNIIVFVVLACVAQGQDTEEGKTREYTKEHPLVYEDVKDFWPYSFLNDDGNPDGFNVELVRMLLEELNIPYVVKMKPNLEAFTDLRDGRSDLILGVATGFHDEYGLYGRNAVTLLTQSVVMPKGSTTVIRNFRDLAKNRVIVNDSSFCHHLMIDYGWGGNAIPYTDIEEAIQKVSNDGEGQIVWNDLSLKWLMRKYQIDNLQIDPVNMPYGEYKFMSNDQALLDKLDSVYNVFDSSEKLTSLRNKWFYPDRKDTGIPSWTWYITCLLGILTASMLVYAIIYRLQAHKLTRNNKKITKRMSLIMEISRAKIWTYDVERHLFTWRNKHGEPTDTYTEMEFARNYSAEDFDRLTQALNHLTEKPKGKDEKEKEVRLYLIPYNTEGKYVDGKEFSVVLSVLRRNKRGVATIIQGTQYDVTEQKKQQREQEESWQRFLSVFNIPMLGIIHFSADGVMVNINRKACQMFGCEHDDILAKRVSFRDFLNIDKEDVVDTDGYTCTHIGRHTSCDVRCMTFCNDKGKVQGMIAVCQDITKKVADTEEKRQLTEEIKMAEEEQVQHLAQIDAVLKDGKIRMARYSLASHTLTILSGTKNVQQELTQARCMTLVSELSQRTAIRVLAEMDQRMGKEFQFDIRTNVSRQDEYPLHLQFSLIPVYGKDGKVIEYFGLCQDITALKAIEDKMVQEMQTVQEIENTKTSFIKNMAQEIRVPVNAIVKASKELFPKQDMEDNNASCQSILGNSNYLLHLIDNILYLSRLEAHMIEIVQEPTDFVNTFASCCSAKSMENENVRFLSESPYEQLVVGIDAKNVGNIIERIVENAIQHTHQGYIRVRYDYIGWRLMIMVEDTGEGISQKDLERINGETTESVRLNNGLGIPICKELLAQMGGFLEIDSEEGLGTTVWITIPCKATSIRRKKIV